MEHGGERQSQVYRGETYQQVIGFAAGRRLPGGRQQRATSRRNLVRKHTDESAQEKLGEP